MKSTRRNSKKVKPSLPKEIQELKELATIFYARQKEWMRTRLERGRVITEMMFLSKDGRTTIYKIEGIGHMFDMSNTNVQYWKNVYKGRYKKLIVRDYDEEDYIKKAEKYKKMRNEYLQLRVDFHSMVRKLYLAKDGDDYKFKLKQITKASKISPYAIYKNVCKGLIHRD